MLFLYCMSRENGNRPYNLMKGKVKLLDPGRFYEIGFGQKTHDKVVFLPRKPDD